jgi:hypothetical protein
MANVQARRLELRLLESVQAQMHQTNNNKFNIPTRVQRAFRVHWYIYNYWEIYCVQLLTTIEFMFQCYKRISRVKKRSRALYVGILTIGAFFSLRVNLGILGIHRLIYHKRVVRQIEHIVQLLFVRNPRFIGFKYTERVCHFCRNGTLIIFCWKWFVVQQSHRIIFSMKKPKLPHTVIDINICAQCLAYDIHVSFINKLERVCLEHNQKYRPINLKYSLCIQKHILPKVPEVIGIKILEFIGNVRLKYVEKTPFVDTIIHLTDPIAVEMFFTIEQMSLFENCTIRWHA